MDNNIEDDVPNIIDIYNETQILGVMIARTLSATLFGLFMLNTKFDNPKALKDWVNDINETTKLLDKYRESAKIYNEETGKWE